MSEPTIRHIAIKTAEPEKLGKFYADVFGMDTILRPRTAPAASLFPAAT